MARDATRRSVQCYHCAHRFAVGAKAISLPCPACHRHLHVDDVTVRNAHGVTRVQTCGRVLVERRGRLIARLIQAHEGLVVHGVLDGNVISGGPVVLASSARWKGDCRAPRLVVEPGAEIHGGWFCIGDHHATDPALDTTAVDAAATAPP